MFDFNDIENIYNCDFVNSIKADIILNIEEGSFSTEKILDRYIRDVELKFSEDAFGDLLQKDVYDDKKNELNKVMDVISSKYTVKRVINKPLTTLYIKDEKNN